MVNVSQAETDDAVARTGAQRCVLIFTAYAAGAVSQVLLRVAERPYLHAECVVSSSQAL